jgi:glycosyltransferase involved in cell wall biosynthesis
MTNTLSATLPIHSSAESANWIALLGRRDEPVDGVEDYCAFLGAGLARIGIQIDRVGVNWADKGWLPALRQLWRESVAWRGKWVLLQYTALGWSRRGFPLGAVAVSAIVRRRGARCALVFHEPYRQAPGSRRWIDRVRGACQDWVVRCLHNRAEKSIFADPLDKIPWLPKNDPKAVFIPIGANIPEPAIRPSSDIPRNGAAKTVAVFCLSSPPLRQEEVGDICSALRFACANGPALRALFVGRETAEAQSEIVRALDGVEIEICNLGLLDAHEVASALAASDAMLCVRGRLYPRRGSALAGVACGMPIVGYEGAAAGTPLEEAGLALVPYRDSKALGAALTRVFADDDLRAALQKRSRSAHDKYFSWSVIAKQFAESLKSSP